jgi:hypothetical protein
MLSVPFQFSVACERASLATVAAVTSEEILQANLGRGHQHSSS